MHIFSACTKYLQWKFSSWGSHINYTLWTSNDISFILLTSTYDTTCNPGIIEISFIGSWMSGSPTRIAQSTISSSLGWILDRQVVLDTLCGGRKCPGYDFTLDWKEFSDTLCGGIKSPETQKSGTPSNTFFWSWICVRLLT